jgi:hypothetical protein
MKNFLIAVLLSVLGWYPSIQALEVPLQDSAADPIATGLAQAQRLKGALPHITDPGELAYKEVELKKKYLELACACQESEAAADQELSPFCFLEAAALDVRDVRVIEDTVQGAVGATAPYDFGTMRKFQSTVRAEDRFRVVFSVDGGGIRGLIPALYFQWIEEQLGHPMSRLGDFFAGTSVGAIIVAGFNCPRPVGPVEGAAAAASILAAPPPSAAAASAAAADASVPVGGVLPAPSTTAASPVAAADDASAPSGVVPPAAALVPAPAAATAVGIPAADIVRLFERRGGEIFPQDAGLWRVIKAPLRFIGRTFV